MSEWGEAVAGKSIQEAKDRGWLVSPYQGVFFVPAARDLMVAAWLPPAERIELVASRTFAKTGLRFWCLSAWARTQGLLFSESLFVTDLARRDSPVVRPGADFTLDELAEVARARAGLVKRLPFASNTIIVPALGRLSDERLRARVELPGPRKKSRAQADRAKFEPDDIAPGVIEYDVSSELDDPAWLIAFLTALKLPRIQEEVKRLAQAELDRPQKMYSEEVMDGAMRWALFFTSPSPNENWKALLANGTVPFLLVPDSLWKETIDLTASRTFDDMTRLRRQLDA